jgi:hypothetical protein
MAISFFSTTSYSKEDVSYVKPMYGNYSFDTSLTNFGLMKERKFRKVNRLRSLLKLTDVNDTNSIYPMVDEFGYTFSDFFIFKSSWDSDYYVETINA